MKYIVLKNFTDKYTKAKYEVNQVLELTEERAKEILSVDKLIKRVSKPKKK